MYVASWSTKVSITAQKFATSVMDSGGSDKHLKIQDACEDKHAQSLLKPNGWWTGSTWWCAVLATFYLFSVRYHLFLQFIIVESVTSEWYGDAFSVFLK